MPPDTPQEMDYDYDGGGDGGGGSFSSSMHKRSATGPSMSGLPTSTASLGLADEPSMTDSSMAPPPSKKSQSNTPWASAEEQRFTTFSSPGSLGIDQTLLQQSSREKGVPDSGVSEAHENGLILETSVTYPITSRIRSSDLKQQTQRIRALILSDRARASGISRDHQEEVLLGPNLFIQNPTLYFDALKGLQLRIFNLGRQALGEIQEDNSGEFVLPLAEVSSCTADKYDHMRQMIARNHGLALAIKSGLVLAQSEHVVANAYSIIVQDPRRSQILKVVPIKTLYVDTILDLLEEAVADFSPPQRADSITLGTVLDDVYDAAAYISSNLGLDIALPNSGSEQLCNKCMQICGFVFPVLSVLFLGLVSFITSHTDLGASTIIPARLHIRTLGSIERGLSMSLCNLSCLDGFIKRPVWTFNSPPQDPGRGRFYLSTSLEDFSVLWGPVRIPVDSGLIFPFADSVLVCGREQMLL